MFTITKSARNLSIALMGIGLVSIVMSFYFSNNNQYSDKEIHSTMIDIIDSPTEIEITETLLKFFVHTIGDQEIDKIYKSNEIYDSCFVKEIADNISEEFYLEGDTTFKKGIISIFKKYKSKELDGLDDILLYDTIVSLELSLYIIKSSKQDLREWKHKRISEAKDIKSISKKIQDKLYCHLTDKEISGSSSFKDIEEKVIHYFHTKESRPWSSLLFNNYFFLGIAVFAVFFIALQYVSEAAWSIVLKRIPEAVISFLPIAGLIMLIIMVAGAMHFGGNHIYHWMADGIMDPESEHYDKIIAGKEAFLNTTFFLARSVLYILGWIYFGRKLKQLSLAEDQHGGLSYYNKGVKTSAWFMVFFAVTSAVASWDWIMSIDTHWFSTLFGWYVFSEWAVIGFATILLITLYLKRLGYLSHVNDSHIHDLGKWVFAFSLVWTYMWFSQYMLIWYSNIPEEVTYFTARLEVSNYRFLFWFSMIINFIIPIVILMSRDAKRHNGRLIFVCIIILIGHWINSYLLVAPGTLGHHGHIGFTEIGMGLGYFGLFIYVVLNSLTKVPLEVKNHPFLEESKHLHT